MRPWWAKLRAFDPMSGTWPAVVVDLLVVTVLASAAKVVSGRFDGPPAWVAFVVTCAGLVFIMVAVPLRVLLLRQRRQATEREAALLAENIRREFDRKVNRAIDMAEDEVAVMHVAGRALGHLDPGLEGVVLLADSSQAHLQLVASSTPDPCAARCEVATPAACPAVRQGHALHFADSRELDACPYLARRSDEPLTATCVPVSVMGRARGVLHVVQHVSQPFAPTVLAGLEIIARETGSRVGLLRAIAQSQVQANTDPLTGLRNRRSMENEVRALLRGGTTLAVAMLDIDHFKQLNDTHGHDTGDRALRLFARVLERTVRDGDLVCRHGGEEFVVVFPGTDAATAVRVLERVRLELQAALSDGRLPGFTFSGGVVDSSTATELDELLNEADIWLLEAKRAGRNCVLAPPSPSARLGALADPA